MKVVFEFDDLHWKSPENCLFSIERLVSDIPNIKLSFFCTPLHSNLPLSWNPEWCDKIRSLIHSNNISLYVHGLTHCSCEFLNLSAEGAKERLSISHRAFNEANLPFHKVFRAPYWNINAETYDALEELQYSHIYSHEDYKNLSYDRNIKTVFYNWNLKDESCEENDLVIAHGHTHDTCSNGIEEVRNRITNFCKEKNPEFIFAHEV